MKLRSSIAAKYAGVAMIACLMPMMPVVADAQTTYEQQQSTNLNGQNVLQVSYVNKMSDIAAADSETINYAYETTQAIALTESYVTVRENADEDSEEVGRLFDYTLCTIENTGKEWSLISSGNVTGYVKNSQLCFGDEADMIVEECEEKDDSLKTGYTLEEVKIKEEEEERQREEEAAKQAAAEAAKQQNAYLLACIIHWEACGEPYEGKVAVGNVVLNRLNSGAYGDSIESVVYAPGQFSGVTDGNRNPSARFQDRLSAGPSADCMSAALDALSGVNYVGGYTSFRALYVANYSAYSSYTIIGDHVFF